MIFVRFAIGKTTLCKKMHPDLKGGANEMSLNEAIIAFRKGKEVE